MQYWLMKSEPDVYGIDELKRFKVDHWDGIRNYQARNFMRDDMNKGDRAFFYHSNCEVPGIAGIMEIAREAYPDHTQFDPDEKYFDPKSDPDNPRWFMVDVKFIRRLKRIITLRELKSYKTLTDMQLVQKGSRLSIMPVTKRQWDFILGLEDKRPDGD
ncbi:MAG: EVE domain-containing protein [Gammaproteobacteria bacterium]|nr:EVE domain-containing protein [Gammaproteobacteria bacterium]